MNKFYTVYDYITDPNSFSLADKMLIPLAGTLLFTYIYYKGLKKYKIATITLTSLAIFISVLVTISQFIEYKKIVTLIEKGNIKVEQGKISKYQPIDLSNHGSFETFFLNEVKFAYSDYHRISGYHHACVNGGLICEEGQEIRVSYYTKKEINYIIKLEVLNN